MTSSTHMAHTSGSARNVFSDASRWSYRLCSRQTRLWICKRRAETLCQVCCGRKRCGHSTTPILFTNHYLLFCYFIAARLRTRAAALSAAGCQRSNTHQLCRNTSYTVIINWKLPVRQHPGGVLRHIRVGLVPRPLFRFYVGSGYGD